MLHSMWRPKIRRQNRHRAANGFEYGITDSHLGWKPPRGVRRASQREIARAIDTIPPDLGWNWAKDRLVPVLERPGADPMPEDPHLSAIADCGVTYGFGIDMGLMFTRVTRSLADRWERDDATIRDVSLANVRRRIYDEDCGFEVPDDAGDALVVRALSSPEGCATSALLVPDALRRTFGDADQIFTAPSRGLLLGFPIDTPPASVDQLTEEAERLDPHPLLLDPFRLVDGRLTWDGVIAASGGTT